MKKIIFACTLIMLLLAGVTSFTFGQKKDEDKVYLVFFYVKPLPALHHEYIKSENEIFKPIHQAYVNAGNEIGWSVFWVETSSEYIRDYDFVVVKAHKSIDAIDAFVPDSFFANVHAGKDWDSLIRTGFKTRESPRREIWVVDKQLAKSMTGKFDAGKLLLTFTNKPTNDSLLYTSLVKDSVIKNWESYSLFLPQQEQYPYHYLTICPFDRYNSLPALLNKTKQPPTTAKSIVKQEMWAKWVGTDLKPE